MTRGRSSLLASSVAALSAFVLSCSTHESSLVDPLDPPSGTADSLSIIPQEVQTAVGVAVTFAVSDTSILGNGVDGPITWTANGGSIDADGVFTANSVGTYLVYASRGGQEGSAHVDVSSAPLLPPPVALTGIELTPAVIGLSPGATQQFAVIGRLSNGNTATVRVDWVATGGAITSGGLFTAGTSAGTFRVIATRFGDTPADTAVVTVSSAPATITSIQVSPSSISMGIGATQQFAAIGVQSNGSSGGVAVNWSATGGSITSGGRTRRGDAGDLSGDRSAAGGHQGGHVECHDHGTGADVDGGRSDPGERVAGGGGIAAVHGAGADERRERDQR